MAPSRYFARETPLDPCWLVLDQGAWSACVSMVLLWNAHVQEPIHAIHINLSCVNFFWKDMNRCHLWPKIDLSGVSSVAAKSNHAMSCHAKNRGHLRISRRFNKAVKLGRVPAKVVL